MHRTHTFVQTIDHINIVVRDLKQMTSFYADVLGMEVYKEVSIAGPWIDAVVGLENVSADVVFLRANGDGANSNSANIELIQYHQPAGTRPEGLEQSNTLGIRHIAFRVNHIDAIFEKCRVLGIDFQSAVQNVPMDQASFGKANSEQVQRKRLCYFRDPEGNLLEFCSYES